jgi:hypothetical protein
VDDAQQAEREREKESTRRSVTIVPCRCAG